MAATKRARRPTRTEAKEKTRAALVRAAQELIAKEGLDAPSLDAICERAGFTRGAFYVHFRDRDELVGAVMESFGGDFLRELMAGAGPSVDGAGALPSIVDGFEAAVRGGRYPLLVPRSSGSRGARRGSAGVAPHQLLAACARSKTLRERYGGLIELAIEGLAGAAQADAERGLVRADVPPRALGFALLALVVGAQTMAELGLDPLAEGLPDVVRRLIRRG